MVLRYAGAVDRYLLKNTGDPHIAAELGQEFALRFLQGGFLKYDASLGRFRDYIKRALQNLIKDYYRRGRHHVPLDPDAEDGLAEFEEHFLESWRDELLDRAWDALEEHERRTGNRYHSILKYRARHPTLRSPEMATQLAPVLGRTISAGALRQLLYRSRDLWVKFLVDEVKVSLKSPTLENIEKELAELGLLELARPALHRLMLE
jgi:hypothetical protein